jgi:hypothetical protein
VGPENVQGRFCPWAWPAASGGWTMPVSVPVDSVDSVVLLSPLVSMVVKGLHGNRGLLPRARASDSCFPPCPSRDGLPDRVRG